MGYKLFRHPQALSSTLAVLGMLQPWAIGCLNNLYPSVSLSNYYLMITFSWFSGLLFLLQHKGKGVPDIRKWYARMLWCCRSFILWSVL